MSRLFKVLTTAVLAVSVGVPLTAAPAHAQTAPVATASASNGGGLLGGLVGGLLGVVTGVVKTVTAPVQQIGGSLFGDDAAVHGKSALDDPGSLYSTARMIDADRLWRNGTTGRGIDVAVIDSGVSPVPGLNGADKVIYGPDLSFDSQAPNLRHLDGYGHGTHMAGIIAARDASVTQPQNAPADAAVGIAPDARIVSLKVAAADGSTDVTQVIAAIDWVVQHRNDNGMNIRVMNLSFGTDSVQSYQVDPLAYAVEVAWRHGIVVVVAAGNDGVSSPLNDPAYDPFVIAVGAADHKGTVSRGDDTVADFSSRGTAARRPDLTAPGRSIASLRDPQSYIDTTYPSAVVGDRFFRGSGSSQAAAVTSGAAALLLQARPSLTPDQVKQVLVRGASPLASSGVSADYGIGRLNVATSAGMWPFAASQSARPASGLGSIDAARGTHMELVDDGVTLTGEQDIQGQPWNAPVWAANALAGRSWSGGWWNGTEWTGSTWSADGWAAAGWTGRSWTGRSWTGHSWSGRSWTGRSWTDASWTGRSWTGRSWTDLSWTGRSWTATGY